MERLAMKSTVVTVPSLPAVHTTRAEREPQQQRYPLLNDSWFLITLGTALLASVLAWKYAYDQHWTLLYDDAHAHLAIARRVIAGNSPGLAQLGGVWLPFPHLIMLPFIWSYTMWQTGLAGSFSSMFCFVITAVFAFLSARRITNNGFVSYVGALVFILNPNVLYLQSTPLSELTLAMTMTITCYYFLAWAQDDKLSDLICAAGATFIMSISRYDGWSVFIAALVLIIIIGFLKKYRISKIISNIVIYGSLAVLAILLWILWNYLIFHDPLYFQRGAYSAQSGQAPYIAAGADRTYHDVFYAIHDYIVVMIQTLGPILFIIGCIGLVVFLLHRGITPETLAILLFLIPIPFYMLTLYTGQTIIYSYGAIPNNASNILYNVRYGMGIVIPASICIAIVLVPIWNGLKSGLEFIVHGIKISQVFLNIVPLMFIPVILFQSFLTFRGGIITLQDGQYGISCYVYSVIPGYLARHYNGGYILMDPSSSLFDISETGYISVNQVIYQGSGKLWQEALSDPGKVVDWIAITPGDLVNRYIDINSQNFNAQFELLDDDRATGVKLYHRRNAQPLPSRDIPPSPYQQYYRLCGTYKP